MSRFLKIWLLISILMASISYTSFMDLLEIVQIDFWVILTAFFLIFLIIALPIIAYVFPISIFISTISLSLNSELISVQTSGISLKHFFKIITLTSLFLMLFLVVWNGFLSPQLNYEITKIRNDVLINSINLRLRPSVINQYDDVVFFFTSNDDEDYYSNLIFNIKIPEDKSYPGRFSGNYFILANKFNTLKGATNQNGLYLDMLNGQIVSIIDQEDGYNFSATYNRIKFPMSTFLNVQNDAANDLKYSDKWEALPYLLKKPVHFLTIRDFYVLVTKVDIKNKEARPLVTNFLYRFSDSINLLILSWLALAFGVVNPRSQRNFNLVLFAIIFAAFIIINNTSFFQIAKLTETPLFFAFAPNFVMFCVALILSFLVIQGKSLDTYNFFIHITWFVKRAFQKIFRSS